MTDYVLNAQIAICYENDPEYIDNLTNELKDFYMTLVPETKNKDFVTGEEAVNIYSLVDEYYNNISVTPDEPDYYVDVPVFKYFSNGYRIINTGYNNADVDEGKLVERINGYIYQVSQYGSLSPFGYLAVNTETGDVLTLDEALEQKIISGSEMCECLKENSPSYLMSVYLIGDADSDGSLSVSDATYIQKIIVGKAEDKSDLSYSSVSDFNDDGRIDVTDVTEIQKQIVGVNDL
ncbi:MAG: dockerin type I repeat-containing protein [Clostridiales bacterium]|nr:dockerin type I repeat-containing protein [Clostridiales bacterium]